MNISIQYIISGLAFFLLGSPSIISAQINWDLDADFIANISASTYVPESKN